MNFFSLLEDNSSTDVVELAKKKAQQQQQQKEAAKAQTKEVVKDTKEQPKQQKAKEGTQQTENRPQTSQDSRGRGRGDRQQRPQTAGGSDRRPQRDGDNKGRGRGAPREDRPQRDGEDRPPRRDFKPRDGEDRPPRRDFKPRTPTGAVGSPVDTTGAPAQSGERFYEKRRPQGGNKPHGADDAPRRGRQFDRSVSGTGRGRGMKKDGEGPHNWGKEGDHDVRRGVRTFQDRRGKTEGKVVVKGEDEAIEGVTTPIQAQEETTAETPVEGEAQSEEPKVETPKEEDNEVTYEEYLKQQAEKKKALNQGLKPESSAASTETKTAEKKKPAVKTPKVGEKLSIQEFLADRADQLNEQRERERDSRGGRGGRGGSRRGGSQRPAKGPAPSVNDQKAFPALSAK